MPTEPKESDYIVFILGAGSSAAYGLPVMNRFMDKARRLYFQMKRKSPNSWILDSYRELLNFSERCRASSWAFRRNWENMEELYTEADLLRLSASSEKERQEAKARCDDIGWTIWDVYRQCDVSAFENGFRIAFPKVCEKIEAAQFYPAIITTNYDCLCEWAVLDNGRDFAYPGFEICPNKEATATTANPVSFAEIREHNKVPIIKLHGSVNWFSVSSNGYWHAPRGFKPLAEQNQPAETIAKNIAGETIAKNIIEQRAWVKEYLTPEIIPPMLGKSSASPVIGQQWNAAIEAIGAARQIWVVGYSFPQTDTFMTRLLTEGLLRNSQLEKFVIVDSQSREEWKPRVEDMFGFMLREHRFFFVSGLAKRLYSHLGDTNVGAWNPKSLGIHII